VEIPWGREFVGYGAGVYPFPLFPAESWARSGRSPGAANRETGGAEQRISAAEQGIARPHRGASSSFANGAVCHAIMAIFAVSKPAHQLGRYGVPILGERYISDIDRVRL
jgi:hypothetical protein